MELGPLVLLTVKLRWLSNVFCLFPALLIGGHHQSESLLRAAALRAQVVGVAAEIGWSACHPRPLAAGPTAVAAALAAGATVAAVWLAFADGLAPNVALALQVQLNWTV